MKNAIEINGKTVIDFTPDNAREICLVDLKVLRRLTAMLDVSSFNSIRHSLRDTIMNTTSIEQLVESCEEFSSFHRSVNLVQSYMAGEFTSNMESSEDTYAQDSRDLDDLDVCARDHSDY